MKFLADMGVSPLTVQALRQQGYDAVHLYLQCRERTPVKNKGDLKQRSCCAQCFNGEMNRDQ